MYWIRILAGALGAIQGPRLPWIAVLLVLTGPQAIAKVKSDWAKVQAVPPGKSMTVRLYDDEAPQGERKIAGRFASATAKSVTLLLPRGQSRTVERTSVRKVLVSRPFRKRWPGWAALAISATSLELFCAIGVEDCNLGVLQRLKAHGLITGLITGGFFGGSRNAGVYNVPPKHRVRSATAPSSLPNN